MWNQNTLQGIPKSSVYCKVATAVNPSSNNIPVRYEFNTDQQTTTTYGLSDTRQMHNPQTGYFVPPEPGVYYFDFCFYLTSTVNGTYALTDLTSGRAVFAQAYISGTGGRSVTFSGIVLLSGSEKLWVSISNGNIDLGRPESNNATFIKLYDLPDY